MDFYDRFYAAFDQLDKASCVSLIHDALANGSLSVPALYEDVLKRALGNLTDVEADPKHKIWREHIQTSIVRTLIEMSFPYVLKQRTDQKLGKAAVVCPDGEEHELGARMVSDYLSLLGYETFFVGKSTPKSEFIDMIRSLDLDLVALSVTNHYNFSQTLKTLEMIRSAYPKLKIVAGGHGLELNHDVLNAYGVSVANSYSELETMVREQGV